MSKWTFDSESGNWHKVYANGVGVVIDPSDGPECLCGLWPDYNGSDFHFRMRFKGFDLESLKGRFDNEGLRDAMVESMYGLASGEDN